MKKQFSENGIDFVIEVDLNKTVTTETEETGETTHFIRTASTNTSDRNYDATTQCIMNNTDRGTDKGDSLLADAVLGSEMLARGWAKSETSDRWDVKLLKRLGLKMVIMTFLISAMYGCHKKTSAPAQNTASTANQPAAYVMDTSRTGNYQMVYCSVANEMLSSLTVSIKYRSWKQHSADTTDRWILYSFIDNISPTAPKQIKLSKSVIYKDDVGSSSQPYIEDYNDKITSGLSGSSKLSLNDGSFKGDTMTLNMNYSTIGKVLCKYKKK